MRRLSALIVVLLLAALGLAACGGDGSSSSSPPAPASALFYASVNIDSSGGQWQEAQKLMQRAPALSSLLPSALGSRGDLSQLTSALGGRVVAVGISTGDPTGGEEIVGMADPKDSKQLDGLLAKLSPKPVVRRIDGWTVWGSTKALDRLEQQLEQGKLADAASFEEAMKAEPEEGLLTLYVDGPAASKALSSLASSRSAGSLGILGSLQGIAGSSTPFSWLAGSGKVTDKGLLFDAVLKGAPAASANAGSLLAALPASSSLIADLDVSGLGKQLAGSSSSPLPGASAKQIGDLLSGELGAAISGGARPVLTLALRPNDVASATAMVQTLLGGLSSLGGKAPEHLKLAGADVTRVSLGSTSLYLGRLGDALVLSTSEAGFTGPRGAGGAAFEAAKKALGMPDKTTGFVFADLKQLASVAGVASSLGIKVPSQAQSLKGLSSLLFYAEPQGAELHLKGLLATG
jgi:hypothetical protein